MHCISAMAAGEFVQVLHFPNTVATLQIKYGHWTSTGNLKSQNLDNWHCFQKSYAHTNSLLTWVVFKSFKMYTDIAWTLFTSPTPVTVIANLNLTTCFHSATHTHNGHNVHHILHYHTELRQSVYLIVYRHILKQNELQELCERIFWPWQPCFIDTAIHLLYKPCP